MLYSPSIHYLPAMDVQSFVKEAITQLVMGVSEANDAVEPSGALVNPIVHERNLGDKTARYGTDTYGHPVTLIDFDLAVTVGKEESKGGSVRAVIAAVGFNAGLDAKNSNESISRVRFQVPVRLPLGKPPKKETSTPEPA